MSKTLLKHLLDEKVLTSQQFEMVRKTDSNGDVQIFNEILRREYVPEAVLLHTVCNFFSLLFVPSLDGISVDLSRVERLGGLKDMKARLYAPVKSDFFQGDIILTSDPFYSSATSRLRITTRDNMAKLLHAVDHEEPVNMDDPEAQLDDIISYAITHRASDIHIDYDPVERKSITRFRIDGYLKRIERFCVSDKDVQYHNTLINKIYHCASIDPSQYGFLHGSSFSRELQQRKINIRLSSVPSPEAAAVVLRLMYTRHDETAIPLHQLGFDSSVTDLLKRVLKLPSGIVLVCGPTSSGKTTTLYSMIAEKKKEEINVVSIEDPIEVRMAGIRQVEVDAKKQITFATASRTFLRQDPNVILIGEIRDDETAKEAINASHTGHLVFSTIHTNTACGVIPRLVGFGISEEFIASTLRVVLSQRLVRGLCPQCKTKVIPPPQYRSIVDTAYDPKGCPECNMEGYKGRIVLWEILCVNDAVKQAITKKMYADEDHMIQLSCTESMRDIATELVRKGRTSLAEVERFVFLDNLLSNAYGSITTRALVGDKL